MNRAAIEAGMAVAAKVKPHSIHAWSNYINDEDAAKIVAALESAQALLAEREWKPIETYPAKDDGDVGLMGPKVLVRVPPQKRCFIFNGAPGKEFLSSPLYYVAAQNYGEWEALDETGRLNIRLPEAPTHWRALSPKEPDNE